MKMSGKVESTMWTNPQVNIKSDNPEVKQYFIYTLRSKAIAYTGRTYNERKVQEIQKSVWHKIWSVGEEEEQIIWSD